MKKNATYPPNMEGKIKAYRNQSKAMLLHSLKHSKNMLPLGAAFLAGAQMVEAQIVYSGVQNISCALAGHTNRCYANINNAGGNDLEFHRNHAFGNQFIQVDEFPGGGFEVNGFHAKVQGTYVYPYANAAGVVIGAGGPWGFQAGQANSLSEINNAYPNDAWTPLANGTTRFVGVRGTVGGATKYGWVRLTKNGFGNFTIVDWAYNNTTNGSIATGQTMPVELVSLDYKLNGVNLSLEWKTETELDNAGFDIERSEDGHSFKAIGWMDGHGTTLEPQAYNFEDKNLREGKIYYYRLRQVDYNGQFDYSQVVTVKVGSSGTQAGEFYPNPVSNGQTIALEFNSRTAGNWDFTIFDSAGKEVRNQRMEIGEGTNTVNFDINGLEAGAYFVKLENGSEKLYRKLFVQ